ENLHPSHFWSDALDRLGISINLQREQNARIPETGRVVAVSNHPYGVIDGLVLCALMAEVREDYKIITHRVLRQAPAVMDKILPIDFDETEAALANNLQVRSDAMAHLKNDGAIIIFPAGAISLAPHLFGNAYDLEWKTFAAKLATQKNTTTVPFYFDGRNSVLYQMARRISQTLGYSLMFREICKLMGTSVNITMRNPIDSDMLKALGNRTLATDYMRRKTYGMS
ncbi:MAG: lysophospholipid acyltransferase family protein, partial [Candidatus Puniceispirillum sp.]